MKFVRQAGRVAVAAASVSTLVMVAACGGGGGQSGSQSSQGGGAADFSQKGPITLVGGKDTSGLYPKLIEQWNSQHPDQQVKLIELSDSADQQRASMIQNAQTKGSEYTILDMDVIWTPEFAANGWVDEIPKDKIKTDGILQSTIDSVTYFNKMYAFPFRSDAGLLFYRKDWMQAAGVSTPPKTFDEMKQACKTIKEKVAEAKGVDCYVSQFQKYEGLTVNTAEAIDSAGGHILDESGKKATVNTPEAEKGVQALVNMFKDGTIPQSAITMKEEETRNAFQDGKAIFARNWPYMYPKLAASDGSSKVSGKFDVAQLPGVTGQGVSSLGGHNYGISKFGKNKGTALEFIKFMTTPETQKRIAVEAGWAPAMESVYSDPEVTGKYPYMTTLRDSVKAANPRPKAIKYGDVTTAIQDSMYATLQGQKDPKTALGELQTKLDGLVK